MTTERIEFSGIIDGMILCPPVRLALALLTFRTLLSASYIDHCIPINSSGPDVVPPVQDSLSLSVIVIDHDSIADFEVGIAGEISAGPHRCQMNHTFAVDAVEAAKDSSDHRYSC